MYLISYWIRRINGSLLSIRIQLSRPSQCWNMIWNVNMPSCFPKLNSACKRLSYIGDESTYKIKGSHLMGFAYLYTMYMLCAIMTITIRSCFRFINDYWTQPLVVLSADLLTNLSPRATAWIRSLTYWRKQSEWRWVWWMLMSVLAEMHISA